MTDPATTPLNAAEVAAAPRSHEALVLQVTGQRVELRLRPLAGSAGDSAVISARITLPGYFAHPGDRVLVHSAGSEHYVIGVLHSAAHAAPRVTAPNGAYAERGEDGLSLFDAEGQLLVSYDTESGALTLRATADLMLSAPNGSVRVSAADQVSLQSQRMDLGAQHLALRGDSTAIDFGRLELRGERLLSRVAEAFIEVERVAETRAKRLRTLVESTLELFAHRTSIRSEKDTRIDGKRILLG